MSSTQFFLVVTVFVISSFGCNQGKSVPKPQPLTSMPLESPVQTVHSDRVIVFVHGIFGSAKDTWRCGSKNWPDLLKLDEAFMKQKTTPDVFVAEYDTRSEGGVKKLDEVADTLETSLETNGVLAHKEVDFVAHSLGGLIVNKLILGHPDLADRTKFVYMLSTPQTGAQVAKIGSLVNGNAFLKAMIPGDEDSYTLDLADQWLKAKFKWIHLYCAYEGKKTDGIWVVTRAAATHQCEQVQVIPNANHFTIAKPCSVDDLAYKSVHDRIQHRIDKEARKLK